MKFCPDMPDEVGGMVWLLHVNSQVVGLQDLQLQGCGSNPPANVTADFTMTNSRLVESHFLNLCSSFKS